MSSFRWNHDFSQSHLVLRRKWAARLNIRSFALFAALAFLAVSILKGALTDWQTAQRKAHLIELNRWPSSRRMNFTARELLALGMSEIDAAAPGAVTNPALQLQFNSATATAMADFDLLRKSRKPSSSTTDWLLSRLITGQHPIAVTVQVSSANNQMTVHPTMVQISGMTLSGRTLHFAIENLVQPYFSTVVVDRPFRLSPHLSQVQITPAYATAIAR